MIKLKQQLNNTINMRSNLHSLILHYFIKLDYRVKYSFGFCYLEY